MERWVIAATVVVAALACGARGADEKDPVKDKLFAAKQAYDKEMREARKLAGDWFDKREEVARRDGNKKALDQIKDERQAFDESGELPKTAAAALKQKPVFARKALEAAYEQAVKDYVKAKKDDQAAAVEKDLNEFRIASSFGGDQKEFEIAPRVKMKFCWIPAGKATLGSHKAEKGRLDNETEHEFETKGYWLGKYEVTQEEWEKVTGANPCEHSPKGPGADRVKGISTSKFPVEMVSWSDCQKFIKKCPSTKGYELRLPTEDEWEYACRGGKGNKQAFYWGNALSGDKANSDGNVPYGTPTKGPSLGRPTEVGGYEKVAPHPWGLNDMHGNVWEWCDTPFSADGSDRIFRGGSYFDGGTWSRSAQRHKQSLDFRFPNLGFRLALVPQSGR